MAKYIPLKDDEQIHRLFHVLGEECKALIDVERAYIGEFEGQAVARIFYKSASIPEIVPFDPSEYKYIIGEEALFRS